MARSGSVQVYRTASQENLGSNSVLRCRTIDRFNHAALVLVVPPYIPGGVSEGGSGVWRWKWDRSFSSDKTLLDRFGDASTASDRMLFGVSGAVSTAGLRSLPFTCFCAASVVHGWLTSCDVVPTTGGERRIHRMNQDLRFGCSSGGGPVIIWVRGRRVYQDRRLGNLLGEPSSSICTAVCCRRRPHDLRFGSCDFCSVCFWSCSVCFWSCSVCFWSCSVCCWSCSVCCWSCSVCCWSCSVCFWSCSVCCGSCSVCFWSCSVCCGCDSVLNSCINLDLKAKIPGTKTFQMYANQ